MIVRIARLLVSVLSAVAMLLPASMVMAQTAPTPPTVASITFSPSPIPSGGSAQLTINFGNANATAATLTAPLTDTLPAGLTVATAGAGGSCPTAAVASAGGGTIVYPTGATIPAGGCSIAVSVTATSQSIRTAYIDAIPAGALVTNEGNSPAAASATLTVQMAVAVPNLVGLSQAQAAIALQTVGLTLGAIAHAPGPAGIPFNAIFSQNPAAGASVAARTAVAINLSSGPGKATNLTAPLTSVPGFVDPSQLSIAAAFERLCAQLQAPGEFLNAAQRNLLANCTAILGTYGGGNNAAGLKSTLDAISGKTATAQQTTGVMFAGTQFTNIGARLAQVRAGLGESSFAGLDLGVPALSALKPLTAMLQDNSGGAGGDGSGSGSGGGGSGDSNSGAHSSSPVGVFVNGSLRRGTQDTTDLETGFDFKSSAITAGVDYRYADWLVLGVAGGYAKGLTDFTAGSGRLDSRNISASIYASMYRRDSFYIDFVGTFGHINYDAARTSTFSVDTNSTSTPANCVNGECSIDTSGSTTARQLAFGTDIGYRFYAGALAFGPDLAINYTGIHVAGFSETDPTVSGLALAYDAQSGESLLVKAGGSASYAISTRFAVILPQLRAHYIHEFENDQRALSAHFLDDPNIGTPNGPISNFVVYTDQPDRSYFDYAAGLSVQFPYGIAAFVDYSAVGGQTNIHTSELAFGVRIQYAQ